MEKISNASHMRSLAFDMICFVKAHSDFKI